MPTTVKNAAAKGLSAQFDDGYSSFYTRVWPLIQPRMCWRWAPVGSCGYAHIKTNFGVV